jgi:hypothetical protein
MTNIVAAMVGSGTGPFVRAILPSGQRGSDNTGLAAGVRTGIQVMVANWEDQQSVDAFAVSGVSIGVTPIQIWGPGINSLPRQRSVTLFNDGPAEAFIGPSSTAVIAPSGFNIVAETAITLPLLHNVQVWARSAGTSQIRILAY